MADAVRLVPAPAADGFYVHADHLGSPQAMTDDAQQEVWRIDTRPFGEVEALTWTVENNQRFPGQYADAESGYSQNWFRDYEPALGRYLQSDPIGLAGGINTFAYVGGNPINLVDVYGLVDNSSPWQVGWEWLTGTGPRTHNFSDNDPFTQILKQHDHIEELLEKLCDKTLPPAGRYNYSLGGLAGVPKFARDYSSVFSGGLKGNIAAAYLGSYRLEYKVKGYAVNIIVSNSSTIGSATHPPIIGYTDWWQKNVAGTLTNLFSSGALSTTTQTFDFNMNLPCSCGP